jgi:TolB protein
MGGVNNVWVMNADGANPTQVTAEGGSSPFWSPDGNRIVFARTPNLLESVPITGGQATRVFELGAGVSFHRLSPDGKQIAYNSTTGGATNLWVASLESGQRRQLTFDRESMGFACWSLDGKFLALGIKRGEDGFIGLVPSTGGEVRQLTFDRGLSAASSWSPDGDKIAFAGGRNGYWNIYWVSSTTKEQRQLTQYNRRNIVVRYPAWSPLSNQIVYEYVENTGNIWLVELK